MYIFDKNSKIAYQGNLYKTDKNGPKNNTSTTKGYCVKNEIKSIVILDGIKEEESLNINHWASQNGNNILMNHDKENSSEQIGSAYVSNYSNNTKSLSCKSNTDIINSFEY